MSKNTTQVRLGWSDPKPAKTFLFFASGITLGVILTTFCMVDFSARVKPAPAADQVSADKTVETQTAAAAQLESAQPIVVAQTAEAQPPEASEKNAEPVVRTDLALQPKD